MGQTHLLRAFYLQFNLKALVATPLHFKPINEQVVAVYLLVGWL
jgi:hypothetical protein